MNCTVSELTYLWTPKLK